MTKAVLLATFTLGLGLYAQQPASLQMGRVLTQQGGASLVLTPLGQAPAGVPGLPPDDLKQFGLMVGVLPADPLSDTVMVAALVETDDHVSQAYRLECPVMRDANSPWTTLLLWTGKRHVVAVWSVDVVEIRATQRTQFTATQ